MNSTKIHTAISTKTAVQAKNIELVSASGRSFSLTSAQASRLTIVSQQLATHNSNVLHLSNVEGCDAITDESLELVVESCSLADTFGAVNACARGGAISQLLVRQEQTTKVMNFAIAVRLLGCEFAFGVSAEVFKSKLSAFGTVEDLNVALGLSFDFNAEEFHRIIKQTKWYLFGKIDGAFQWLHDLWVAVKTSIKHKVKDAWRKFKAVVKHTVHAVQFAFSEAHRKLFCEILPSLHAEVVARLSMTCSWLRNICLPTMYSVLVVRPGLWLQTKACEFKRQLNKFFEWFELHQYVLKIEISAKVDLSVSRKRTTQDAQCQEVVRATDYTFLRVQQSRQQFTKLYKCDFNGTTIVPHWSESIAKLDLKCVQLSKSLKTSSTSIQAASLGSSVAVRAGVDTLKIDSRELTGAASALFLYKDVKTLRVAVKFTRDELVSQQSGIWLVASPASKNVPAELFEIRRELHRVIQSTKLLVNSSVTEIRYEFIEKSSNTVSLILSDSRSDFV